MIYKTIFHTGYNNNVEMQLTTFRVGRSSRVHCELNCRAARLRARSCGEFPRGAVTSRFIAYSAAITRTRYR